jgi:hypothetical protein
MLKAHVGFWWRVLMKGDNSENLDVDGRIILKCVFKKCDEEAWSGLTWLRLGSGDGRL